MCETMKRIVTEENRKINRLNVILLNNNRCDDLRRTAKKSDCIYDQVLI